MSLSTKIEKEESKSTKATLELVAKVAGVSRATVSRVVNGSSRVAPETLETVSRVIQELNYVPNRAARTLASSQAQALALVVPEDTTRFFGDPYFALLVNGLTGVLNQSDFVLNLIVASNGPASKTLRYLTGGNVDGAFVVSHHTDDTFLAELSKYIPVVYGGRPQQLRENSYFVDVDNRLGAVSAVEHLIKSGRTRIATITGPTNMVAAIDRTQGWIEAISAAGLEVMPAVDGLFSYNGGAQAMRQLLKLRPDIDAVFIASDLMARGAINVLQERSISIPHEIAVVGYDDSPAALSGNIQLTTVHQPSIKVGAKMAEIMLEILSGIRPGQTDFILPTELIVRDSA